MAALWLQDWVGVTDNIYGERLVWNWQLNFARYPHWQNITDEWMKDGVKPMIYINPFFIDAKGDFVRENQFEEAVKNGYFIKKKDGTPYILRNANYHFGMVDLTNPDARNWVKGII